MSGTLDPSIPDESRQVNLRALSGVMIALIVSTTLARVVAKGVCKVRLGLDDYFIILGLILNLIADSADIKSTYYGFGRHAQYLSSDELIGAVKWAQIAVIVAVFAIWSVKVSICFLLLAFIRGTHKVFRWATYGLLFLTTASTFIVALLWGLQAHPIAKLWDPNISGTRKSGQDFVTVDYILFSTSAVTDFFYALSPIYFLWNIQMNKRKKITLLSLIGCGLLITVIAFLNIAFAQSFLDVDDITWALINEFICDMLQRNMSLVIANLPALWVLLSQLQQRVSSRKRSKQDGETAQWTEVEGDRRASRKGSTTTDATRVGSHHRLEFLRKESQGGNGSDSRYRRHDPYQLEDNDQIPLRETSVNIGTGVDHVEEGIQVSTEVKIHAEHRGRSDTSSDHGFVV